MENIVWEMTPWVDDFGMTYEGWSQSEEKGMTNDTLSWRFQNGMTFDASPYNHVGCGLAKKIMVQ